MPTKLARPPMSVRPVVSAASSAPTSKSSAWTRINSAPRYRWKQGDLVARLHRMIEGGVILVDRNFDRAAVGECRLMGRAQRLQPVQQFADIAYIGRRRQLLARFAELAAQPGEVKQLHRPTSLKGRKSTMLPDSSRVNASGSST